MKLNERTIYLSLDLVASKIGEWEIEKQRLNELALYHEFEDGISIAEMIGFVQDQIDILSEVENDLENYRFKELWVK